MSEHIADLADHVEDLVKPGHHAEPYTIWRKKNRVMLVHRSEHLSLIGQLRECTRDRSQSEEDSQRPARTVPRLDIDAVDRMTAIRKGVAAWLDRCGLESRAVAEAERLSALANQLGRYPRSSPVEIRQATELLRKAAVATLNRFELDIPAFVGVAPEMDSADLAALAGDVYRWRTWCRIFGGWETRPWKPHVRCPHCEQLPGERKGLRIRLHVRSAACLSCDATWDQATIGLLAQYIQEVKRALDDEPQPIPRRVPLTQNRGG